MTDGFRNYREWWNRTYSPATPEEEQDSEKAFEEHVNSLSNYELMITLDVWENDIEL